MLHTISKTLFDNVANWLDKGFYQKSGIQRLSFKEDECELSIFKYDKETKWKKKVTKYSYHAIDSNPPEEVKREDLWAERIPLILLDEIDSTIPTVLMFPDSSVRVSQLDNLIDSKKDKMYIEWLAKKSVSPDGKYTVKVNQNKECFIVTGYSDRAIKTVSRVFDGINIDKILPDFSVFEKIEGLSKKVVVFFRQSSASIVYYNKDSEVSYFRVINVDDFDALTIDDIQRFCCTVLEYFRINVMKDNILYKAQFSEFNYNLLNSISWISLDDIFTQNKMRNYSVNDICFLRSIASQVDLV